MQCGNDNYRDGSRARARIRLWRSGASLAVSCAECAMLEFCSACGVRPCAPDARANGRTHARTHARTDARKQITYTRDGAIAYIHGVGSATSADINHQIL